MDKEKVLIGAMGFVLVASIGLIGFSIYLQTVSTETVSPTTFPSCANINYNGASATNLVFMAPDFESAKKYSDYLTTFGPFKDHPSAFNTYFVPFSGAGCSLYKNAAVMCYSRANVQLASACPNDIVVAVTHADLGIRSSTYMNFITVNDVHPTTVLAHEFGHAFGYLSDEYVPAAKLGGSKNCASDCTQFGSQKDGCYSGCSTDTLVRSVDSGVMRTLASNKYGAFDDFLLEARLTDAVKQHLTGNAILSVEECSGQKYSQIVGSYDAETKKISLEEQNVVDGCYGGNGNGQGHYALYNDKNEITASGDFNPSVLFFDGPSGDSGEITGNGAEVSTRFILKTPLATQTREIPATIEVKHADKITRVPISDITLEKKPTPVSQITPGSKTPQTTTVISNVEIGPRGIAPFVSPPTIKTPSSVGTGTSSGAQQTKSIQAGATGAAIFSLAQFGLEETRVALAIVTAIIILVLYCWLHCVRRTKRRKRK